MSVVYLRLKIGTFPFSNIPEYFLQISSITSDIIFLSQLKNIENIKITHTNANSKHLVAIFNEKVPAKCLLLII